MRTVDSMRDGDTGHQRECLTRILRLFGYRHSRGFHGFVQPGCDECGLFAGIALTHDVLTGQHGAGPILGMPLPAGLDDGQSH